MAIQKKLHNSAYSSEEENQSPKKKQKQETEVVKKYTDEEVQLLYDLKENQKRSWTEIQSIFPDRTLKGLQNVYPKVKSRFETLSHDEEERLRQAIADDDKKRWKRISAAVGKSEITCRNKAKEWGLTK